MRTNLATLTTEAAQRAAYGPTERQVMLIKVVLILATIALAAVLLVVFKNLGANRQDEEDEWVNMLPMQKKDKHAREHERMHLP